MTVPCFTPDDLWKHLNEHGCFQNEEYTDEYYTSDNVWVYEKNGFFLPINVSFLYFPKTVKTICDAFDIPMMPNSKLRHSKKEES